jgi:hypothetical protein
MQKTLLFTIFLSISTYATAQWTTAKLSQSRGELAATYFGGKVYFLGGLDKNTLDESNVADIYDPSTKKWTVSTMPAKRYAVSHYATATNLYTYGISFGSTSKIDVYDPATSKWSQIVATDAAKNPNTKIKGLKDQIYINYERVLYEYDLKTNTSTPLNNTGLSRPNTTLEVAGTKVMIAGGLDGNVAVNNLDIYDTATKKWTFSKLSAARWGIVSLIHNQKAYFIGGRTTNGYKNSDQIDVYDIATDKWSTITMPIKRFNFAATAMGDFLYIAGGYSESLTESDQVNIYNLKTNTWTEAKLSEAKVNLAATNDGKSVYFAGGNNGSTSYSTIDIFTPQNSGISTPTLPIDLSAFPNPTIDKLSINLSNNTFASLKMTITDVNGRIITEQNIENQKTNILLDTQNWQKGTYFITLETEQGTKSTKIIKL